MKHYREEYERWLSSAVFDEDTKRELSALSDEKEIEDRFYRDLAFGTGGLRGVLGAGSNRMNEYTVGRATQGLAAFLNAEGRDGGVVIAYDSRRRSKEFAHDTACILAANGVKAYLFESLRPTPMLSFAVRHLKAAAGVVITASHNPPEYNGYKVYFSDGCQIVPPYDKRIISFVNAVSYEDVRRIPEAEAKARGLLIPIGEEVDAAYFAAVKALVLSPEALQKEAKNIRIVYTPLNGTGNLPVRRVLKELGFEQVFVVPEQEAPDGNFPTLKYPNPEDRAAFTLALALAKEKDADLVLATDPDADRLGVYVKEKSGEYRPFTGNMSGILIAEYLLSRKAELGLLPQRRQDGALVTTIVSTDMARALAAHYGITEIETLTGFKYIGEQIARFEAAKQANGGKSDGSKGAYEYLFGFEESYGCLTGSYARDKDAVSAAAALAEAACYYRTRGMTLADVMDALYARLGYFEEGQKSLAFPGADGAERMKARMQQLREHAPARLGNVRVLAVRDYSAGIRRDEAGESALALPKSNVLYFELEEGGWCCVRPSGTEPKLKIYYGAKGASREDAENNTKEIVRGASALFEA